MSEAIAQKANGAPVEIHPEEASSISVKQYPKEADIVYRMIRKSDGAKVEVGVNTRDKIKMIIPGLPMPVPCVVVHVNRGKGRFTVMPVGAVGVSVKDGK